MILVKLLGFAMLIGTVMGSVLGLQIVIDRLVAAQRRKRVQAIGLREHHGRAAR